MSIDFKELMKEVKENHAKLESCSKHDFSIAISPVNKFGKMYRCANCDGEVDSTTKYWYDKGLEHGK
jgi:predicted SprT family Zn-dependent metalloprotease